MAPYTEGCDCKIKPLAPLPCVIVVVALSAPVTARPFTNEAAPVYHSVRAVSGVAAAPGPFTVKSSETPLLLDSLRATIPA